MTEKAKPSLRTCEVGNNAVKKQVTEKERMVPRLEETLDGIPGGGGAVSHLPQTKTGPPCPPRWADVTGTSTQVSPPV